LYVGDVVLLQTGEKLPTDGVLLRAESMQCDESALTGEPDTVAKSAGG